MEDNIPPGHTQNFGVLSRALKNGDAFLYRATEVSTGERVTLICIGDKQAFVPFAKLLSGDPFTLFQQFGLIDG